MLDRDGDYWTIVPNRERHAYRIGDVPMGSREVTTVTIGKEDQHWSRALTLPSLVELTLHEPTHEQLAAIGELRSVKRLRVTHAKVKTIEFIRGLTAVEELVLEYVSGFTDLSPLQSLPRLRALHIENLRRVVDFSGLSGVENLRYLAINGTLDWKQPIDNFKFLRGLPMLEVLCLWQMITKQAYPALLPALSLKKLKKLKLHSSYLATAEYALLEEGLRGVEGAEWGPHHTVAYRYIALPPTDIRAHLPADVIRAKYPEVTVRFDGKREIEDPDSRWIEFTGKGERAVKLNSATAETRCREYVARYAALKQEARRLIDQRNGLDT
ncbi:hypothetical protein [Anatilimnocola floriformis]|uniref:hypothetical protein n=1 Tax=Anatilimnocola floriformis TaxID=2948575 RepID=UPI0020C1C252|nr:hypothetical protein [Anatilimnocola floriformis]